MELIRSEMKVSERRICRVLAQRHSTQCHQPRGREDKELLVTDIVELTWLYGSYGYSWSAVLPRAAGGRVSDGWIERP